MVTRSPLKKCQPSDSQHKWIGTYNLYRTLIVKFFKWLYYPDIEPSKRIKPLAVGNIPQLKRKEKSIYKPTDLWTAEDDLLFKILSIKENEMLSYGTKKQNTPGTTISLL